MTFAAKHMDPVVGIDMHMVQPPPPAPPVMMPVPFVGYLIDPADYSGGCTIHVNGLPRARAGTPGVGCPPHVPPGGAFLKPPTDECEMYQGASTVVFDGDAASAGGHQVLSCHDVGIVAPVRNWKQAGAVSMMRASCSVIPISGVPVLIGGVPTVTLSASSEAREKGKSVVDSKVHLKVYDAFGNPYSQGSVSIFFQNGDVEESQLDSDGCLDLLDCHGDYVLVVFEELEAPDYRPVPRTEPPARALSDDITKASGPVGSSSAECIFYVIQQGETVRTVALRFGIPDWRSVYLHPSNEEMRKHRSDPSILLPGDGINIPILDEPSREYRNGGIVIPTNRRVVVHHSQKQIISVKPTRPDGESYAGLKFGFIIDSVFQEDSVPNDGVISLIVPISCRELRLRIWEHADAPSDVFCEFKLAVNFLDPIESPSGARQRLALIGYPNGQFILPNKPPRRDGLKIEELMEVGSGNNRTEVLDKIHSLIYGGVL